MMADVGISAKPHFSILTTDVRVTLKGVFQVLGAHALHV